MAFTADQLQSFQVAWRFGGAVSTLGCLAIISSFLAFKKQQTLMNKLVVFMSIADLVASISQGSGSVDFTNQTYCDFQGFGIEIAMLSYVCWQASVATHCMLVATAGKPLAQLSKYIKYYHIVSWVLPVIISIILYCLQFVDIPGVPQGTPVFGNATFFCWISNSYATYRLVFFYVPLWTTFVYCVFVYGYIWRSFVRSRNKFSPAGTTSGSSSENTGTGGSNAQRAQLQRGHERFIKKAACYMIAFVIAWTPATINRIQNIIAPQYPNYYLFLLHSIFSPLQGLFNAFIYFTFMIQIHNRALARRASTLQSRSSKTTNTTPAVASATPAPLVSAAGTNLLGNSTSETTLETQPLVDEEEEDDY